MTNRTYPWSFETQIFRNGKMLRWRPWNSRSYNWRYLLILLMV